MKTPRNLTLLLINDEPLEESADFNQGVLLNDFIKTVEMPHPSGKPTSRVGDWWHHMHLWGKSEDIPEIDLMLIDVRFDSDTFDPDYYLELQGKSNPFGLLHALPLASRRDLTSRPFVWEIHSADVGAVQTDAVAVICYGLLSAIAQTPEWQRARVCRSDKVGEFFARIMGSHVSRSPTDSVRALLPKYRAAFVDAVKSERMMIEGDTVQRPIRKLSTGTTNGVESTLKVGLAFAAGSTGDCIYLRSLFADVNDWSNSVGPRSPVVKFLEEIADALVDATDLFERTKQCLSLMRNDEQCDTSLKDAVESVGGGGSKTHLSVCVLLCQWLESVFHRQPFSVIGIASALGFNHQKQTDRIIARAGFKNQATGEFFTAWLERNSLPSLYQDVGRLYCSDVLGWRRAEREWPSCLCDVD